MNKVGRFAEKDVLTLFLLECYTGARSCDCEKMSLENVRDGKLSYVADKTMTLVTLPVHYKVNELLQNIPARTYAEAVKVRIIKRVAKSCGINEVITITYRGVRKPRESTSILVHIRHAALFLRYSTNWEFHLRKSLSIWGIVT